MTIETLQSIPDDELLAQLSKLLERSRWVEAELVAHIGEVDARRLYARRASPSMFSYCVDLLHLSEHEAYLRIAAARAARAHPVLLEMLADGRLHLSGIAKLAAHLTEGNRDEVLARATHKSKRQIEELVAELAPRPDVPANMRKVPERRAPRVLTTTIDLDDGTASLGLAMEVAAYFELGSNEATVIGREVGRAVSGWRREAAGHGLPPAQIDRMASAFEHEDLQAALSL